MAKLLPLHQIATVENGNAREILEAAADQIEVAPDPAQAGIGIETGKDRIAKSAAAGHGHGLLAS